MIYFGRCRNLFEGEGVDVWIKQEHLVLGASEVSANLYYNSRPSVLGRLRDYLRLLMKRSVQCTWSWI